MGEPGVGKTAIAEGIAHRIVCLLYTSDAADERSSVDLGGRRIIKKKTKISPRGHSHIKDQNE